MDAPRRLLQRAFLDTDARRREVHAPSHRPPQRRTDTVPALIVPLARWRTFWSHALRCSLENHKPRRRNTVYLDARGVDAADDPEVVKSMTLRQRPSAPLRHTVRYRPFSVASLPLASGAVTSFVPNV